MTKLLEVIFKIHNLTSTCNDAHIDFKDTQFV